MATKKRKKNDSLDKHREVLVEKNTKLVLRACEYIRSIGGEINYSNVAKATASVVNAENNEKPITSAAISKNETYRAIVVAESKKQASTPAQKSVKTAVAKMSLADLNAELFEQRTENRKLKKEIRILTDQLSSIPNLNKDTANESSILSKENEEIIRASSSLVKMLLDQEIAYLDLESEELRLATYEMRLMKGKTLLRLLKGTPYDDKIQKRGS